VAALGACSDDDASGDAADATTTTEAPVFTGDASSPFCTTLAEVQGAEGVLGDEAGSPADIEAGFTRLVTVWDELAELAPEDVVADAATIAEGISALNAVLSEVGYDFDALAASPQAEEVVAAQNDPAFRIAGDRLEAYKAQVCKL
jgi:hypothetical protein